MRNGSEQFETCTFRYRADLFHNLVDRLTFDLPPAGGAVERALLGSQQKQVIVDFVDGSYSGAGVLEVVSYSMAITGKSPLMEFTTGLPICPRNWRA